MDTFAKQPSERIAYTADFTEALKTGDDIATISYTGIVTVGGTGGEPTIHSSAISDGGKVNMLISGGADTGLYKVTVRVTTTLGEELEHDFRIKVKER